MSNVLGAFLIAMGLFTICAIVLLPMAALLAFTTALTLTEIFLGVISIGITANLVRKITKW